MDEKENKVDSEVKTEFDTAIENQEKELSEIGSEKEVIKNISGLIEKAEKEVLDKIKEKKLEISKKNNPDLLDKDLESAANEIELDKSEENNIKQEIYDNLAPETFRISERRNDILDKVQTEAEKLLEDINEKIKENDSKINELKSKGEDKLTDAEKEELSNLESENSKLNELSGKLGSKENPESILGRVSKGFKQQKGIDEQKDNLLMEKFPEQAAMDEKLQKRVAARDGKENPSKEADELEKDGIEQQKEDAENSKEEKQPKEKGASKQGALTPEELAAMAAMSKTGPMTFEQILGYNPDNVLTPRSSLEMLNVMTGLDPSPAGVDLTDKMRLELLRDPKCQEVLSKAMETLEKGKSNLPNNYAYKRMRKELTTLSKDTLPKMALSQREGVDMSLLNGIDGYDKDVAALFEGNPPRIMTDKNIPQEKLDKVDELLGGYGVKYSAQRNQLEQTMKNASPEQAEKLQEELNNLDMQKDALYRSVGDIYGATKFRDNAHQITKNQLLKIGSMVKDKVTGAVKSLGSSKNTQVVPSKNDNVEITNSSSSPVQSSSWKEQTVSENEIADKDAQPTQQVEPQKEAPSNDQR